MYCIATIFSGKYFCNLIYEQWQVFNLTCFILANFGLREKDWLDNNQRIKMLQIALQYTLPKLKQEVDEVEDLPLFVD